jgi:glucose/arabinose dehydrogenase
MIQGLQRPVDIRAPDHVDKPATRVLAQSSVGAQNLGGIQPSGSTQPSAGGQAPGSAQSPGPGLIREERLFIAEQHSGTIMVFKDGALLSTPFLDIGNKVASQGSSNGLLSFAFHPDYADNGHFYVDYTRAGDSALVIERYTVSADDPDVADPNSGVVLLTEPQISGAHPGGCIQFGYDGYLYIAIGDAGAVCQAQSLASLLGKIIPLDVNTGVISTHNLLIGLRNPWRFSFDRETGDLYLGNVGEADREQISFLAGGSLGITNYGWPSIEGSICGPPEAAGCPGSLPCGDPGLTEPIHDYAHGPDGFAVMGGYVYRGKAMPELRGTYFFGDHSGKLWSFRYVDGEVTEFTDRSQQLGPVANLSTFGEDADGELYFAGLNGKVYKMVPDR